MPRSFNSAATVLVNKNKNVINLWEYLSLQIRVCVELKFNATKYTDGKSPPSPACVEVRNGTNAHEILKLAATQDPCFNFTVKMTMWGNSVRSICGVHRRPADKVYWMIKIDGKSAKTGIDYLIPGDGSTLVFVYKQLFWRKWKKKTCDSNWLTRGNADLIFVSHLLRRYM